MDEKGKQVGLLTRQEALKKAFDLGLDLVEIAPNAKPPVAKLIDFKKFKYLEAKREQQIKKKAKEVEVKEIHLRPFIGEHDFEFRRNQAEEFLKSGDRVKIVVKFQGREFAKKEFGFKVINRFIEELALVAKPESAPRFEGRVLALLLTPVKKINVETQNEKSSLEKVQDK